MRAALLIAVVFVVSSACQIVPDEGDDRAARGIDEPAAVEMAPSKNIRYGKSCSECDFNIKHGLSCTKPAKKTCGAGDLEKGSGWCIARKTDSAGYCSGRCKGAADCPSGFACSDLKTGVKVCTR